MIQFRTGQRILFTGDSITECGRGPVGGPLGYGYAGMISLLLQARHPEVGLDLVNTAVGGNTVVDLERRWDADVIAHDPDWLFVMIGTNDVLWKYAISETERAVDPATYRETYRKCLARTRERCARARIVLLQPPPPDTEIDSDRRRGVRDLLPIIDAIAAEHGAEVCRIHDFVDAAMRRGPAVAWLMDVPHPNFAAHMLIALAVLEHVGWEGALSS